ncbi:methyl-accepting chemotaxis domain protein [Burkholderia thailandensis]|uniref:Methyl-accepting chemotaxis domain protein n=1 Tax=Burkholderia thailandensis TaxID=57975 RepID=A0AAW9CKD7_BURTH|nr:methyl-accepting chemotaxis domain protein [Burkholderia thailandensis]MDW9251115.1 methyl-accepting chemotaxis domain protein [Burkholderia thailandensis]
MKVANASRRSPAATRPAPLAARAVPRRPPCAAPRVRNTRDIAHPDAGDEAHAHALPRIPDSRRRRGHSSDLRNRQSRR